MTEDFKLIEITSIRTPALIFKDIIDLYYSEKYKSFLLYFKKEKVNLQYAFSLRENLRAKFGEYDYNVNLILNLENVDYIDSTIIGMFLSGYNFIKKHNRRYFIYNMKTPIKRIVKLINTPELNSFFSIHDSLDDVLLHLSQ